MFRIKLVNVSDTYLVRVPKTQRRKDPSPFRFTVKTSAATSWKNKSKAEQFLEEIKDYKLVTRIEEFMEKQVLVTCSKCGWVHMQVTRSYAEDEVRRFNEYYDTLSKDKQDAFYGGKPSSIKQYESCWCGNSYKNFRDYKEGDCPTGCTIGPIIARDE